MDGEWSLNNARAAKLWLHLALQSLDGDIREQYGNQIVFRNEPMATACASVAKEAGADTIVWSRTADPLGVQRESRAKAQLQSQGYTVRTYSSLLLREPWSSPPPSDPNPHPLPHFAGRYMSTPRTGRDISGL
jgi:deoxyribodipyrimidine photolyase